MINRQKMQRNSSELLISPTSPPIKETLPSGSTTESIMGDQLMDETIKEPSLDRWLDHSPKLNTPKDIEELVANLQHKRQMFISAEQRKREPKVEGEDTNETVD
jgi:hypothetical protein